jgi:hypothetical protein
VIEKAWAAYVGGVAGFGVSMAMVTGVLQFITAVLALISTGIGLWLLIRSVRKAGQP